MKLKRFRSFITELFDSDLVQFETVTSDSDEFKLEFDYKGDTYFFQARYENKIEPKNIRYGWHIGFGKGYDKDKYDMTNKGYPFKIISIIKNALNIFIEKYKPKKMSFIAEGDAKSNIYLSFFDQDGYTVGKEESGLESFSGKTPWLIKITKN